MARLSAQELAELVPCPLEQVRRLEELGILEPHEDDGLFPASAVHVVRLMAAFEEAGISLEDVARGMAAGKLSFPLGLFLPEPVAMSATYEELAPRLARSPDLLRRLSRELGLPPVADDRLRGRTPSCFRSSPPSATSPTTRSEPADSPSSSPDSFPGFSAATGSTPSSSTSSP